MPDEIAVQNDEREESARIYEVGYLLVPALSETELPREVTALKDVLEKEKVSIVSEEFPKFRTLAYVMRKRVKGAYQTFSNAHFGWIKFASSPEAAERIDRELKQSDRVLRHLIIKTVREDTRSIARARPEYRKRPPAVVPEAKPSAPVSEAELDRSLEKLIAE